MITSSRRVTSVAAACCAITFLAIAPACQKADKNKGAAGSGSAGGTPKTTTIGDTPEDVPRLPKGKGVEPVQPPMDVTAPPADAQRTASGISYKILQAQPSGERPGRNDTVTVNYTGWKTSGETYFSTRTRGKPQPMSLATTAAGWTEALQLMKTGERAIFWIPPNLAFKGTPKEPMTLVYEIELVSFEAAPPVPADVAQPPADASKTKSGLAFKVLARGTGSEKPHPWDNAMINYSAWDSSGRMFDSTVVRKRPKQSLVMKEMPGLAEGLQLMVVGERTRFWIPEALTRQGPNVPAGTLVYEVELTEIKKNPEPPPVPRDVAAPPKDAKKTAKGVWYKVLKAGTGKEHPKAIDTVVVDYTGWTTDGQMFDTSATRGQPARFPLNGVIAGWTDAVALMVVGETTRMWIPEELAYRGAPGKPQGMLVFDIELVRIVTP